MQDMNVEQFYSQCHIPPNLARHMLEVTAVAAAICAHWTGERPEFQVVIKVALMHDLGNLIKFKRPFLGELELDAEFWSQKQDELRAKYGEDVHQATMALAQQGTLDPIVLEELNRTGQVGSPKKFETMEGRIIELADMCVSPAGIVGPVERIDDLIKRYGDKVHMIDIHRHRENVRLISAELDLPLNDILQSISRQDIEKWRDFELGTS